MITLQFNLFALMLCKQCAGTGLEWRERPRRDVEGDVLEVWVGDPYPCSVCNEQVAWETLKP